MRHIIFVLLSLQFIYCHGQTTNSIYALRGVTIIDANNKTPLTNQTILIKGTTILKVFTSDSIKLNDSIRVIDLKGKYVIPGLIDTHVHIGQEDNGKADRDSAEFYLHKMLLSGITSVRDMNGDARFLACLSRDAKIGDIPSPDIYYSALMAGPEFWKERRIIANPYAKGGIPGQMPYWKLVTDSTDIVLAVAEAKGSGATGLKLYTDIKKELVIKIVKEAKRQGMRVWSHAAIIPAYAIDAINAGVEVISHADGIVRETRGDEPFPEAWKKRENPATSDEYWNDELNKFHLNTLFARMNEMNTIFDATLCVFESFIDMPSQRWRFETAKRIIDMAHKAGVKICTGTDTDLRGSVVQDEIKYLVKYCNFSPIDVIISSTKIGAEAIGIDKTCGTIEPDKFADLLILDKNPLDDIKNIESVNMVIKSGLIYK